MNAPTKAAETAVKFGLVQFKGRIQGVRKQGNFVYTLCKLPAADEYSSPQTVEIISKARFASVGDDFTAACTVAGYPYYSYLWQSSSPASPTPTARPVQPFRLLQLQ